MAKPKILYSCSTLLAYRIGNLYYNDIHWVYCSPEFGSSRVMVTLLLNPPTSLPLYRYKQLKRESEAGDTHGLYIAQQRTGITKGAVEKHKSRIISKKTRDEILAVVQVATPADFKPLIYVIPYQEVKYNIKPIPVYYRAHPLSQEYLIEALPREKFDILDLDEY